MSKEAQIQYNAMLKNGDLEILFPSMTGEWTKDKKRFTKIWEENQKLIQKIEVSHEQVKPNNK